MASLPDNWLMIVIERSIADERFAMSPVNREESAIGLCSGAYMGAMGSAALMGASGFMTVIYAITKINYTYEIPLFLTADLARAALATITSTTFRTACICAGADADQHALQVIDKAEDIPDLASYHHTRAVSPPAVIALTRDLLRRRSIR